MRHRTDEQFEAERQELLDEIRSLKAELRKTKQAESEHAEQLRLVDEITDLKRKLADLRIEEDRLKEAHEREKRDVTHMVGLERKRQAFEIDQAKRETTVTVREENLAADRKRFEEQMAFTTERFEKEVVYLKGLMESVLERLPTVTVDKTIESIEKKRSA